MAAGFLKVQLLLLTIYLCNVMAFVKIRCRGNGKEGGSCLVPDVTEEEIMNLKVHLLKSCQNGCDETNFGLEVKSGQIFLTVSKDCNGVFRVQRTGCGMGDVPPSGFRIINGHFATSCRQFPWMVLLSPYCGASIINRNHLLTAAHCLLGQRRSSTGQPTRSPPSTIRVYTGSIDDKRSEPSDVEVDKYFLHEEYNNGNLNNDIAVIRLKTNLTFNDCQRPVCLESNQKNTQSPPSDCRLSGFGWHVGKLYLVPPKQLKWVSLKISNETFCKSTYKNYIPGGSLCTEGVHHPLDGFCGGDSGSPLVCKQGNLWYQYGVVSGNWVGCYNTHPGLYASVPYYYKWIQSKINSP